MPHLLPRFFSGSSRTALLLSYAVAFAVLTASSHIAVPAGPVPVTMQTLAVTLCGALLGPAHGLRVVLAWVIAGLSGLPLFAFGVGGAAAFTSPTFGYLVSFPLIAALTGVLCERGGFVRMLAAMLAANLACLAVGASWLAVLSGASVAWTFGVVPFLPGAVLKSLLGALVLHAAGLPERR